MLREDFDEYIRRFNAEDFGAFEQFIATDLKLLNGTLLIEGRDGMKAHYAQIWSTFKESLQVQQFVSDATTLAIQMWAHFDTKVDNHDSLFGPVVLGDQFDFRGLILYKIKDGQFTDITVAYNSFIHTNLQGKSVNLGIVH